MVVRKKSIMGMMFVWLSVAALIQSSTSWEISPNDEDIGIRAGDPVTYTAAVYEYEPYCEWTEEMGYKVIRENAYHISQFAADAKAQGVDILVSAEYGIQSWFMHGGNDTALFTELQFVPDPGMNIEPCSYEVESDNIEAVRMLSCAARDNQIYMVVDMGSVHPCSPDVLNPYNNVLETSTECPENGYLYYNTHVVFDRNGVVISRYRKKNLFLEWWFSPGLQPNEEAMFTTDFGVTFTSQLCYDITNYNPGISNVLNYGIKDVIMSTAWTDILPFHIAPAIQNGFSRSLGVNLIVSGYHLPEDAKMGSGIYHGASDQSITLIYDPNSGSKYAISQVETTASVDVKLYDVLQRQNKISNKSAKVETIHEDQTFMTLNREHNFEYDDISGYTHGYLIQGESQDAQYAEVCHDDGLCCQLTYYPTSNFNYTLVAFSGPMVEGVGAYNLYMQVCGVLWCRTDDITSCANLEYGIPESDTFGAFELSGTFGTDHVYPIFFNRNLELTDNQDYNFNVLKGFNRSMTKITPTQDLMTLALYGRWFERDS